MFDKDNENFCSKMASLVGGKRLELCNFGFQKIVKYLLHLEFFLMLFLLKIKIPLEILLNKKVREIEVR